CKEVKYISEFKKRKSRKGYDRTCKECNNLKNKEARELNLDKSRKKSRIAQRKRRKNPNVRKKDILYNKQYFKNNPEYRINYERERRSNDIEFVIRDSLRGRIRKALKRYNNGSKVGSAVKDL